MNPFLLHSQIATKLKEPEPKSKAEFKQDKNNISNENKSQQIFKQTGLKLIQNQIHEPIHKSNNNNNNMFQQIISKNEQILNHNRIPIKEPEQKPTNENIRTRKCHS